MKANAEMGASFLVEMATKGESKFNRVFDWTKSMLITISPESGSYNLKMQQKRNRKCDKNKKLPSFECINSFLASKSPCNIPWLNDVAAKNRCSEQQMKQHFELAFNIMTGNGVRQQLRNFGCAQKSCIETYWKAEKFTSVKQTGNISILGYFNAMSTEVHLKTFLCNSSQSHD